MNTSAPDARRLLAVLVTGLLLGGALLWSRGGGAIGNKAPAGSSPEACLGELTLAAREGNVASYLACFGGPLAEQLAKQAAGEASPGEFARQLRESTTELRGIASYEQRPPTTYEAELVLERIYPRVNERYRAVLRQADGRWRVYELTRLGAARPPIEYGAPVSGDAGEAGATDPRSILKPSVP